MELVLPCGVRGRRGGQIPRRSRLLRGLYARCDGPAMDTRPCSARRAAKGLVPQLVPGTAKPPMFTGVSEAPGVGLEPTTFRLTAGRVCQLSYPGPRRGV